MAYNLEIVWVIIRKDGEKQQMLIIQMTEPKSGCNMYVTYKGLNKLIN